MALLFVAAGCHRDEVKVYRVAKDQDQPQQQTAPALPTDSPNPTLPPGHPNITSAPAASMPPASESTPTQLTWKTPEGWAEIPPTEMRIASFKVASKNGKQADVSIVPLPGMAGTDAANVNRWRGQVGLSVLTDEELKKAAENVEAGGQPAQLYDIAGTNPGSGNADRILGVIQHRDGMAWFYKMTGDADLVEQQKPAFVEFLKSLNFGAAAQTQTEMPAGLRRAEVLTAGGSQMATATQAGHPAVGDVNTPAMMSAPISHEGQPNWQVPAGWQEVSGGQFLVAKFTITGEGGATTAVNVSSSPGEGGGLVGNVNRWRGQLGLGQLSEDDVNKLLTAIDIAGGKAQLVDLSGTDTRTRQPTRLVGVIVPQSGQTWFYKLMGDAKVVESQKAAFTKFVQGVKY